MGNPQCDPMSVAIKVVHFDLHATVVHPTGNKQENMYWVLISAFLVPLLIFLISKYRTFDVIVTSVGRTPNVHSYLPWPMLVVEFLWDIPAFLERCRVRYGPVYRLRIAGQGVVIVSHAETIKYVMKDPHKCFTNNINTTIFEGVGGVTPYTINSTLINNLLSFMHKAFSNRNIHLLIPSFNQQLSANIQSFACRQTTDRVSLVTFVGRSLYSALSLSFCGPLFPTDTFSEFMLVDSNTLHFLFPFWPSSQKAYRARASLKSKLGVFIERVGPELADDGESSYSGIEILKILKAASVPPSDQQGVILGLMLAMHAASIRMTAWFMAYILSDSSAMTRLRAEVDHAIETEFGSLESLLSAPSHRLGSHMFPLLESALKEVLRLSVAAITAREVNKDTILTVDEHTSFVIRQGDYLVTNGYTVNFDNSIFEDARTFRIDRFLKTSAETVDLPDPVSSFGGGAHMCKGQDFAMYEMKVFAITCLRLLEIEGETASGRPTVGCLPEAVHAWPTPVFFLKDTFVRVQMRDVADN
ncbi:unnamed protein product [Somion occarium]|uniref:Cytochrome P450 n=1 Tax=Somion occarium TaxID=3059160 RepID=A0ABP1CXS6_9APHY